MVCFLKNRIIQNKKHFDPYFVDKMGETNPKLY